MLPIEKDAAYLWDMLDSARTIQEFIAGMRFEEFLRDRKLQLAIELCVENIGEASRRISDDLKMTITRFHGDASLPSTTSSRMSTAMSSRNECGWLPLSMYQH
jgi:hypothetical protein